MEVVKLEKSSVKAIFDVDALEFEEALNQAFDVQKNKVEVKGFRKGHITRNIYEKNFGVESLYEEALNVVLNNKYKELIDSKQFDIVSAPQGDLESDKINRGEAFKVSLTFDVMPEVQLGQYKGVEVSAAKTEVSDEEVQNHVKSLIKDKAVREVKDGAIEKGDIALFDFKGTVDGVAFDGGTAENYELEIGSGQFIPGFEDQMLGMKANEEKDVNVVFPENYHQADLAGKPAVFHVLVHEVKVDKLPELDNEMVKELNIEGVETVDALYAHEKEHLLHDLAQSEKDRQTNEVIKKVLDNTVVDIPNSLMEEEREAMKKNFENQAKQYNIPFDMYLQLCGITNEKYEEIVNENAKQNILFRLVFQKVVDLEKLAPTDEEFQTKVEEIAKTQGISKEEVTSKFGYQLFNQISYEKFVEFLLNNAVIK